MIRGWLRSRAFHSLAANYRPAPYHERFAAGGYPHGVVGLRQDFYYEG